VNEPHEDLRSTGRHPEPDDEGLTPLEQPEPLVIPPDVLRQQYREEYERLVEEQATRVHVHLAEYVTVKSLKQVFSFMRLHMRVYNDARVRKGFAGGGIRGQWWAKRFWTYTIWESREDMERFTKHGAHAELVERIRELAGRGSCYVEWDAIGEQDWSGALARLEHPTRYYVDPYFG
jgi:hypothetical protein